MVPAGAVTRAWSHRRFSFTAGSKAAVRINGGRRQRTYGKWEGREEAARVRKDERRRTRDEAARLRKEAC